VVGELGQVRFRVLVHPLERLADLAMESDSTGRRQLVVENVADEGVREAKPPGRGRGHDSFGDCALKELKGPVRREPAYERDRIEAELSTEDGRERQDAPALLGQPSQPMVDHCTDAVRDRES
jgi:hypothetical protein